jgi:hypothetical protein
MIDVSEDDLRRTLATGTRDADGLLTVQLGSWTYQTYASEEEIVDSVVSGRGWPVRERTNLVPAERRHDEEYGKPSDP